MSTINRGMLKNRARQGRLMAKCNYRMTDDYLHDAASDFGKTDWMPVALDEDAEGNRIDWRDRKEGVMYLRPDYFSGHGRAYKHNSDSDIISLHVHSNLCYSLKIVD